MNDGKTKIPARVQNAIDGHVETGCGTGGFVKAVLENNLSQAIGAADPECSAILREIVEYVHWEIPGNCHGSVKKVKEWQDKGGEKGRG